MAVPIYSVPKGEDTLSTGIGSGLSSILQGLGAGKVKQMQAQQFEKAGVPGFLAYQPESVQAAYFRNYGGMQQQAQAQQAKEIGSQEFMNLLQGQSLGEPQEGPQDAEPTFVPQSPGAKGAQQLAQAEAALQGSNLPPTKKEEILGKIEARNEKLLGQQEKINTQNKKWLEDTTGAFEGSQEADIRLDEMEKLVMGGKLPGPLMAQFAESLEAGIPIPGTRSRIGLNLKGLLFSPKGQKFDKLVADFSKNAVKFFPRVTEGQVKLFLKSIPSLAQSDEGKLEVMQTLRLFNGVNKLKFDTAQQLIENNRGFQPPNLQQKVNKIISPQIRKLEEEFKQRAKAAIKKVRQPQSKGKIRLPTGGEAQL